MKWRNQKEIPTQNGKKRRVRIEIALLCMCEWLACMLSIGMKLNTEIASIVFQHL